MDQPVSWSPIVRAALGSAHDMAIRRCRRQIERISATSHLITDEQLEQIERLLQDVECGADTDDEQSEVEGS